MATSSFIDDPGTPALLERRRFKRARALRLVPTRLLRATWRPDYLAFCYHLIGSSDLEHFDESYPIKSIEMFERDIRYLARSFGFASAGDFAVGSHPVPRVRARALLTFDDGYREWHSLVAPMLRQLGCDAIFFVTTNALDNERLLNGNRLSLALNKLKRAESAEVPHLLDLASSALGRPFASAAACVAYLRRTAAMLPEAEFATLLSTWDVHEVDYLTGRRPYLSSDEVRGLAKQGFVIGAHGLDHRSLHDVSSHELERQIAESCEHIHRLTGQEKVPFAFPYSMRRSESELDDIRNRHPRVGAYFGTGGLWPRRRGFHERILADWRFGASETRTNLPLLVSHAYLMTGARALSAWRRT